MESNNLPDGVTDPYYNRDNGVVYPFGYGMSYTTFDREIESYDDSGDSIELSVKVTNTGDTYAGKDVVQIIIMLHIQSLTKRTRSRNQQQI